MSYTGLTKKQLDYVQENYEFKNYKVPTKPGKYINPDQNIKDRNVQEILRKDNDYDWNRTKKSDDQISFGKNSNFGPHNYPIGDLKFEI